MDMEGRVEVETHSSATGTVKNNVSGTRTAGCRGTELVAKVNNPTDVC